MSNIMLKNKKIVRVRKEKVPDARLTLLMYLKID